MQFRPYGDTGRVLSCLGVEISSNIKTQHQYNLILERAFSRGINYIQFDYKMLRRFINLKEGLDKSKHENSVDIGVVVPSNIIKIKNILKKITKQLDTPSIDFLIIQGKISDSILINRFLTLLKKDSRVRHIVFCVSDVSKDIDKLEHMEGLDGVNFRGNAVLKALKKDYSLNIEKGTSVHNIYSGDKYKAENSLIFISKALANSDIHLVTHRFINSREVDFVVDYIEKEESLDDRVLTDEDILSHVKESEYYEVLKGQKSMFKKIKSIFRKKRSLINV
ncbi:MAG: hypothetical protein JXR64_11340 [Spirochaetales bacterium]|nr:hypothetical protein [Spirochaetales bacterium]